MLQLAFSFLAQNGVRIQNPSRTASVPPNHDLRFSSEATHREYVRTTIVLPAALDQNLEIYCAREAKTKNEAVIEALKTMLKKGGLEPLRLPKTVKVDVSYY